MTRWASTSTTALYLDLTTDALRRLVERGVLRPHGRLGRSWRFDLDKIDRLVERGGLISRADQSEIGGEEADDGVFDAGEGGGALPAGEEGAEDGGAEDEGEGEPDAGDGVEVDEEGDLDEGDEGEGQAEDRGGGLGWGRGLGWSWVGVLGGGGVGLGGWV